MLRHKLQEMTDNPNVIDHARILENLTREYPNSIRIVPSINDIRRYTCLMHALSLTESSQYEEIVMSSYGSFFAGADFAHWLLNGMHLHSMSLDQIQSGDLVIYFEEDRFKHIGLWQEQNRVLSKWGTGNLYSHELMEVPSSYGNNTKFYKAIPHADVISLFEQYVESRTEI